MVSSVARRPQKSGETASEKYTLSQFRATGKVTVPHSCQLWGDLTFFCEALFIPNSGQLTLD